MRAFSCLAENTERQTVLKKWPQVLLECHMKLPLYAFVSVFSNAYNANFMSHKISIIRIWKDGNDQKLVTSKTSILNSIRNLRIIWGTKRKDEQGWSQHNEYILQSTWIEQVTRSKSLNIHLKPACTIRWQSLTKNNGTDEATSDILFNMLLQ
jgi:hypothetical protein